MLELMHEDVTEIIIICREEYIWKRMRSTQ